MFCRIKGQLRGRFRKGLLGELERGVTEVEERERRTGREKVVKVPKDDDEGGFAVGVETPGLV